MEQEIINELGLDTEIIDDIIDLSDILSERLLIFAKQINHKICKLEKENKNGR